MWASGAYGYLSDYLWWWVALASLVVHTWCFFRFVPRGRFRRLGLVLGNALVFLTLLCLAGLIGESYVRFLVVETDAYGASLVSKRWFLIYPQLNSLYCRDKEWAEGRQPGVTRVAFVGDSFTYGWGINEAKDRFTDILQARFDAREPRRVEVMNVAWSGWGAREYVGAVHDMIQDYGVDEIVLCHVPNDIEALLPVSPKDDFKLPPKSTYLNVEHSFLLNYVFHRVVAPHVRGVHAYWDWLADGYRDAQIWRRQEAEFDKIRKLCEAGHVRLRVVLLPFIRSQGLRFDQARIHAQVKGYFSRNQVPVVDALPLLDGKDPGELMVNRHDAHPNQTAHQLFADLIWNAWYRQAGPGAIPLP